MAILCSTTKLAKTESQISTSLLTSSFATSVEQEILFIIGISIQELGNGGCINTKERKKKNFSRDLYNFVLCGEKSIN